MFRITQTEGRSHTVINIDGQLTGECARLAEEYCSKLVGAGKPLHIVLQDVSEVDEGGRAFLSHFAERGISISGNGVYMTHLVSQIRCAAKEHMAAKRALNQPNGGKPGPA